MNRRKKFEAHSPFSASVNLIISRLADGSIQSHPSLNSIDARVRCCKLEVKAWKYYSGHTRDTVFPCPRSLRLTLLEVPPKVRGTSSYVMWTFNMLVSPTARLKSLSFENVGNLQVTFDRLPSSIGRVPTSRWCDLPG